MGTRTPSMPVLLRAAACVARVISDKTKEPCICALRVINAVEVQSAYGRRAQSTAEQACRAVNDVPRVGGAVHAGRRIVVDLLGDLDREDDARGACCLAAGLRERSLQVCWSSY